MARFEARTGGLDSLSTDLKKLGRLTDEDAYVILEPAGQHLAGKFSEKVRAFFRQHTGALAASFEALRKKDDGPYILVSPQGVHHKYRSRKKKGGGMKNAQASEVAFVLEYGDSHHAATHFMENTINEEEAATGEKLQEGFDRLCEEKGIL